MNNDLGVCRTTSATPGLLISAYSGSSFLSAGVAETGCYWGGADALNKLGGNPPLSYSDIVADNMKRCNIFEPADC